MKNNKNAIIYVLVIIMMEVGVFKSGLIENIKQKYHNNLLSKVEKISILDESLNGNIENNINNYGLAAETRDSLFYSKGLQLYRSNKEFNNETGLISEIGNTCKDTINVVGDWIFFRQGKEIRRMKTDGNNMETIFRGYSLDMHVIGNWVYFNNVSDDSKIYRMDVNGQKLESLSEKDINDMAIYDNKIYYSYEHDGVQYLKSMNFDGSEKHIIANIKTRNMIVEEEYIYYIDFEYWKIYRFRIKERTIEKLSDESILYFCKDDKWIFYTIRLPKKSDWLYKGLYRMDVDGSNVFPLDGENFLSEPPIGILESWILYNSTNGKESSTLKRIMKDGTNKTTMGD